MKEYISIIYSKLVTVQHRFIFSPQNPQCNDFFENFHKILIPCLESRVMKLMTRNLVEIEANL